MGRLSWTEKRFAKRLAKEQLTSLRTLHAANPDLPKKDLYRQALTQRAGYDAERAASLVSRAERGVSWWPRQRDLTFREVVHNLAVSEYAERCGGEQHGTCVDFRDIIDHIIPADL